MDRDEKAMLLEQFNRAATYVDDLVAGKTTIAKAANIPRAELDAMFEKGKMALQLEDYDTAQGMFASLLFVNPKDMRSAMGLGGALEGLEQYEMAVPVYFIVIATTLYDPVAPFRSGMCLLKLGKKDEALKMFALAQACKGENKDAAKQIYIQKAEGMIKVLMAE